MVGYYRQYIEDFATKAKPLSRLTSKGVPWLWDEEAQTSFNRLRTDMVTAPILGYPDPKRTYILDTDASGVGVGAVLSQEQDGKERVIAYYSKPCHHQNETIVWTRHELLAVVKATKHFRPYLYGQTFRLRTDHASYDCYAGDTNPPTK